MFTKADAIAHQEKHGFKNPFLVGDPCHDIIEFGRPSPANLLPARKMNKTEAAFQRILEAKQRRGEILSFAFEGMRLTWGSGMHYTPDFNVCESLTKPILHIEVKGAHIWSRDKVRFKGCRSEWKDWFRFEMWQLKRGVWEQIY